MNFIPFFIHDFFIQIETIKIKINILYANPVLYELVRLAVRAVSLVLKHQTRDSPQFLFLIETFFLTRRHYFQTVFVFQKNGTTLKIRCIYIPAENPKQIFSSFKKKQQQQKKTQLQDFFFLNKSMRAHKTLKLNSKNKSRNRIK